MPAPPGWIFAGPIAAHLGPIQYILNAAPHARSCVDPGIPKRLQRLGDQCCVDHVHWNTAEYGVTYAFSDRVHSLECWTLRQPALWLARYAVAHSSKVGTVCFACSRRSVARWSRFTKACARVLSLLTGTRESHIWIGPKAHPMCTTVSLVSEHPNAIEASGTLPDT